MSGIKLFIYENNDKKINTYFQKNENQNIFYNTGFLIL